VPQPQAKFRPRVFSGPVDQQVILEAPASEADLPSQEFKDELPVLGEPVHTEAEYEVYSTVTLRLPQAIFDEYSKLAIAQELSVEEVMQHRLVKCRNHNALRGLWFSDSERAKLEDLIKKRPLETAMQTLALLSTGGAFSVEGLDISLTIPQRKVLDLRTRHSGLNPKKLFEDMIRREFRV
jgi:hypothetical protein